MTTTLSSVNGVLFQDRKFYIDNPMSMEEVMGAVRSHQAIQQAYKTLHDYYRGKHIILNRTFDDTNKPNNKLVHNFPKLIVDNSVAYFMGKPVSYSGDLDVLDRIQPILDNNNAHSVDSELAKYCAEFGHGFEVFWYDENSDLRFKQISPQNMMVCYSMDIDEQLLCGIHYKNYLKADTKELTTKVTVYTDSCVYEFEGSLNGKLTMLNSTEHYFGQVPVIEYISNEERLGDFETVLTLIDAYNISCADSVNDINYLNDAYLLLKNLSTTDVSEINEMKNNRVMLVDGDGDASWLVKNINDLHIENIKKRLVDDIHKFAMTPNISDEKFASNLSGVAISYKLNSLESKTAVKERHFAQSLKKRVALICNSLKRDGLELDANLVYPTFTRNIPQNLMELVQTAVQLQGVVPNEELLSILPFIDDVDYAMDKLREEREELAESGYGSFELGGTDNVRQDNKQTSNFDE